MTTESRYVLTVACDDVPGIVASVSTFLHEKGGFVVEAAQFGDPYSNRFFLRMDFTTNESAPEKEDIREQFEEQIAKPFKMDWQMRDVTRKQRVVILVSKFGHCLNDLLHRYQAGTLPIEIPAIISNHDDMRKMAEWHDIPYHHLPVSKETKMEQEAKIWEVIKDVDADLVVLARYMQILSPGLSAKLSGRAINIHHSFLPSFKGARPYHQAYERGVKVIGATAHYVTDDLDEGPIIEQETARVEHSQGPDELVAIGRDIESVVLARAVRYHIEHRVLINGGKTVVFR
ncbi:MAG: formyltetrahydrofolate deformylase [Rickettsiales bacterium]|nr:formyltetrahydrofolate deformylase [Rickettsiales bacterium]